MTSFVHVAQPTEHPGVARAARAAGSIRRVASDTLSARGAASLMLAAIVSALLVVANQVVETWSEGHLLLAWIVLWTIAFAALALVAGPVRRAVRAIRGQFRRAMTARHAAAQDDIMWRLAMTDARMLADISRAMSAGAAADVRNGA
jgi:hypothetical protein